MRNTALWILPGAHVVREICLLAFYMEPAVSVDIDFHGPSEPDLGNPDLSQSEKDISPKPSNLSSDHFNVHLFWSCKHKRKALFLKANLLVFAEFIAGGYAF